MSINIINKEQCCGCSACVQKCPKQCIKLVEDNEGFLYPSVDHSSCTNCGLCETACIELNPFEKHYPQKAYACYSNDEIVRKKSSSGGVFSLLAKKTIANGGVVFGARYDANWECFHDYIESPEDIDKLRGSKYIPSKIGDCYKKTRSFLNEGRHVLFVGTSCQIAALNKFLNKEYEKLLTVEVTCHGVPSPIFWRKFKEETLERHHKKIASIQKKNLGITQIDFRNKDYGWRNFHFSIKTADIATNTHEQSVIQHHEQNPYMGLFLSDLILRPSCYKCPAKSGRTNSDLTLADFWHIDQVLPEFDDDQGTSLVFANTDKGESCINNLDIKSRQISIKDATELKTAWFTNCRKIPKHRSTIFKLQTYFSTQLLFKIFADSKFLPRRIVRKVRNLF